MTLPEWIPKTLINKYFLNQLTKIIWSFYSGLIIMENDRSMKPCFVTVEQRNKLAY